MDFLLTFIIYVTYMYIFITDIKSRIIPETGIVILIVAGFIKAVQNGNMDGYYIGMCSYQMPLLLLYMLEDFFQRELIGFGDIKLMIGIGGILTYRNMEEILKFYHTLYFLSGITLIFLIPVFKYRKVKMDYIPFAPFIIISYIIRNYNLT